MKNYYIQLLTPGTVATLNEFADTLADDLVECAQFVPRTKEEISTLIKDQVKSKWRDPDFGLAYELPEYLLPVTTVEIWVTEQELASTPLFRSQDGKDLCGPLAFQNVLTYWPAVEDIFEDMEEPIHEDTEES